MIIVKKYELTNEVLVYKGKKLWRIRHIPTDTVGGWVESYDNLSQYGSCMVWDDAKVYGNARVYEDAIIDGSASVYDDAEVFGNAVIHDNVNVFNQAKIYGKAEVTTEAVVQDQAQVLGNAKVEQFAKIGGHAVVYGHAKISGHAEILDYARVYGYSQVLNNAVVKEDGLVHGHVIVKDSTIVQGKEEVFDGQYTWDDIKSFSTLKLYIEESISNTGANLYANGRHQVQVEVIIKAKDVMDRYIKIPETEIFQHIQFVNYRNDPFGDRFQYSDSAGDYCTGLSFSNESNSLNDESSSATFYLSTLEPMGKTLLCVSCMVTKVTKGVVTMEEYSTAIENNSRRPMPYSVTLQVMPPYSFNNQDIEVVRNVKNEKSYTLTTNYVRFKPNNTHRLRAGICQSSYNFYEEGLGTAGKYYSAISTDNIVETNDQLFSYRFGNSKTGYLTVTDYNHEYTGLCFWIYYKRESVNNSLKENLMLCSLLDIYGNEAKLRIMILPGDRTVLNVIVL